MVDPIAPTSVSVYEAATEAAAMDLMSTDVPKMALRGWVVSKQRWSGPEPAADTSRRLHAAAVVAALAVAGALLAIGWEIPRSLLIPFAVISAGTIAMTVALSARRARNGRKRGHLWVVWSEAPVHPAERQRRKGKLNPGGYCRLCGAPREVGATLCVSCATEVSHARSGPSGR